MRWLARGVVLATAAAFIVAFIAAPPTVSCDHCFGSLIFDSGPLVAIALCVLAPAAIVWWLPTARALATWSAATLTAVALFTMTGTISEAWLARWPAIAWPLWIGVVLGSAGSAALAFGLEPQVRMTSSWTPRTRFIQQATRLALSAGAFAIFATFSFGDLPLGASFLTVTGVLLALAPASLVYRMPHRATVLLWAVWSSLIALLVTLLLTLDDDRVTTSLWFPHVLLMALLILVLPIIALVGNDERTALPRARLQ